MSTGDRVFGVFEGRTPCQGIAREMAIRVSAGCAKVKWRVTLLHNPATRTFTTYKIEGTLFRSNAREGAWSIDRIAAPEAGSEVYQLQSRGSAPFSCCAGTITSSS